MNTESLAVAVIVLAFALRAAFQLFPAASRRGLARLRAVLGLKPAAQAASTAACGSGCGSCNHCGGAPSAPPSSESPIQFQPRARKP
ncbi:MAG: hypothetical protein C0434_09725 [Xanthomonadaceae bacterium]|nr:hypothetical protein [Xanthomonadaceae bacterium]